MTKGVLGNPSQDFGSATQMTLHTCQGEDPEPDLQVESTVSLFFHQLRDPGEDPACLDPHIYGVALFISDFCHTSQFTKWHHKLILTHSQSP